jgi:hypothetical protein
MAETWFYAYEGKTHGPFSPEEIKALVATGLLGAQEPVWPEGKDASEAIPASAVGDGASPPPAHERAAPISPAADSSVPDWLGDVASLESARAVAQHRPEAAVEAQETESSDWLEDLRIWVGLDIHEAKRAPQRDLGRMPAAGHIPIGKPVSTGRKKKPRPPRSTAADSIPIAMPVQPAAAEPEVPTGEIEMPIPTVDTLARQTLAETGFDFKTGRIVNPAKFKKWKQQKARASEANQSDMTNASQLELFRRARTAVENWVEDEKNRQRILTSSPQEIKNCRALQDIYTQYAGLGFRQKLEKYLEFLVKNRKRFYETRGGQHGGGSLP